MNDKITERRTAIIGLIQKALVENRLRTVQCLLRCYNGQLAIKFTSIPNEEKKEKIKEITDRFIEDLALAKETKSTLIYYI